MPYTTEAVALIRNTDLLPDVPESFDAMRATCDENGAETCVVTWGGGGDPQAYPNYPFVSAFGGYIFKFDPASGYDVTDVGLDSPERTIDGGYGSRLALPVWLGRRDHQRA